VVREERIAHDRGALHEFLRGRERGAPVAVETVGNWYWIVDEIEAAGCRPKLVHARKAKLMMGTINKTDRLDARGLNLLQRNGTLPTVWIPPGELRDQRELPRTRMVLVRQRAQLKNRIHGTLAKYALHDIPVADLFGVRGRVLLRARLTQLPTHTAYVTERLLAQVEQLTGEVDEFEERLASVFKPTGDPAADDVTGGRAHPRGGHRARGGRRQPVFQRGETGRLQRDHASGAREWREDALWASAA
jgi:transposase